MSESHAVMRHLLTLAAGSLLVACASAPSPPVTAEIDGAHIHFSDTGGAGVPIVFVHGWACDSSFFAEQIPALEDVGRLIAIDLPGHGHSDKPRIAYSIEYWARSIDAVMQSLAIDRAVFVGHSNGAAVARQYYRMYPRKTLGLITLDGALLQMMTAEMAQPFIAKLEAPEYRAFTERLTRGMTTPGGLDATAKAHILSVAVGTPQHVLVGGLRAALAASVWQPDPIGVPVLAIHAKQPSWNDDYRQRLRQMIPKLEYHELEGANHCVMMDVPDTCNALIRAFILRHRW